MLAVAVGALPVLPRLAPVDRGQPDQQRPFRQALTRSRHHAFPQVIPRPGRQPGPHLQSVIGRRVVRHDRRVTQPRHRPADQVALGRVQVAARRIDAQRPTAVPILFPGGQRQSVEKEARDILEVRRRGWDQARHKPRLVAGRLTRRSAARQWDDPCTSIPPERLGLIGPVEIAWAGCKCPEVMLGGLVIGHDLGCQGFVQVIAPFARYSKGEPSQGQMVEQAEELH